MQLQNQIQRKIAIIRVEPINFGIRDETNKQVIIRRFQSFLNSLDFPIQIIISSSPLNLDSYISELTKRVEDLVKQGSPKILSTHLQSYKEHLLATIKDHSVLDRTFDIVIAETTNLSVQIGVCLEQLKSLNLKTRVLNDAELIQLLSSCFNDIMADRDAPLKPEEQLTKENYLHYLIAPRHIKNQPDHILVGKSFCRIIFADGYPRKVDPGFLDKIITLNGIFDISIFIEPIPIEEMMIMLNKELQKQRADLYAAQLKSILNPSLEIQYNDTKNVLEQLQKGNEKLFNISLYINCKAQNKEEVEMVARKVEAELNSMLIIPKRALFRMADGLKSTMPMIDNKLQIKRNIQTSALSAFFPFTSKFLQLDNSGVWIGLNKNDVPLIRDIFKLTNPNGLILASSGSGKSYFTKLFIIRQLLNGTKVMVIDPQSEYLNLLTQFDGDIVNFSRNSETIINPLDLMGHDYADKRLSLLDLFQVMLGEISEIQKAVLDRALTNTYQRKGFDQHKPETWKNKPPILGDLYEELEKMARVATIIERETYRSLLNRIAVYVDGVFSFFNRQTNIKFRNTFVGFVIGDMPKQAKPVNMFLILDYVYMHMKKDLQRKLLIIDEAWSLLSRAEDSSYIFEIVKTCRKFNMGLLLITQDVADLLSSRASAAILQNSSYKVLMRQETAVIENVGVTFGLSMTEKERLLTASVGEGILLMDNEHTEIKSIASKKEHEIITTNADELLKAKKKNPKDEKAPMEKEVKVQLDEAKGFYRKADLTLDDIDYLLKKKYILSQHVPLGGGRQEPYFLKPSSRESAQHFFLVKAIEEYLLKYTKDCRTFETTKPDIIFNAGKKKIAIEVETGTVLQKEEQIKNKISLLRKYDDWFFVITDAKYAYLYEKFGRTLTRKNVQEEIRKYFKKAI